MIPNRGNSNEPWKRYICIACGLIYDEAEGDPDSGLAPGTRFKDIPDDWECPVCGVTKKDFRPFVKNAFVSNAVKAPSSTSNKSQRGIIIIGAGMAGWAMVEAFRARNDITPITLITSCDGHRYNKPELSVSFSRHVSDSMKLVHEDAISAANRLGVTLIDQTFVVSVSSTSKQIRTTRGTFAYTKLIIAQGSQATLPDTLPEHLCWRVNQLSDWQALHKKLSANPNPKRIAIVGAGMVGCELAEDLCFAGHKLFLLSRNTRPLLGVIPEQAGMRLQDSMNKNGITFISSATIEHVAELDDGSKSLRWNSTEQLQVDEIIATTGVVTGNRIAKSSKLKFDNGIVVDPKTLATSKKDIYAVGDCTNINGRTERYIAPIEQQTAVVADALAVDSKGIQYHDSTFAVALKTKSLPIVIHGRPDAAIGWNELENNDHFLHMEQRKNGAVLATLRVGIER